MKIEELKPSYDLLQAVYGDKNLTSIYNGGCQTNPDICFIFMNPTGRNIASSKEWNGIKAPWLGTKNIWKLFYAVSLFDEELFKKIQNMKSKDWTPSFCTQVYENVEKHKYFITNFGKCTQTDARPLANAVYMEYLALLEKEIEIVSPKVIITFGNQVSSLFLNQPIQVSKCRGTFFEKKIENKIYKVYPVYYPVGNGMRNIDFVIEDIKDILKSL